MGTILNDDPASGCPFANDVVLLNDTLTGVQLFGACATLTVGPSLAIETPGDITFRAGQRIVLDDGFSVGPGARFVAEIQQSLVP